MLPGSEENMTLAELFKPDFSFYRAKQPNVISNKILIGGNQFCTIIVPPTESQAQAQLQYGLSPILHEISQAVPIGLKRSGF